MGFFNTYTSAGGETVSVGAGRLAQSHAYPIVKNRARTSGHLEFCRTVLRLKHVLPRGAAKLEATHS
jgi:hypothetical protein